MSPKSHPDLLLKLILRARSIAAAQPANDRGYMMVVVTFLTLMTFSLLGAYLLLTDISKSSSNASLGGNNTFITSESGLNIRANDIRNRFTGYARPTGTAPNGILAGSKPTNAQIMAAMRECANPASPNRGTGDFQCAGDSGATTGDNSRYNNSSNWLDLVTRGNDSNMSAESRRRTSTYTAYSFVVDKTNYVSGQAPLVAVPTGQPYAGLQAQSYTYTVYSSAVDNQSPLGTTNDNTVLQMDFNSRLIPLFQFAAFYDGDLEMNSTSNMTVGGRVHTNGNFYVQPMTSDPAISTTYLSRITTPGGIYNRVDSAGYNFADGSYGGITRVLMTGTDCSVAGSCVSFPPYKQSYTAPLGSTPNLAPTNDDLTRFNGNVLDGGGGVQALTVPEPGFLRKRNYFDNQVGEYWSKADLRLEMVPDRANTLTTANAAIIPFNFTAIHTGGSGTCTTTAPAAGSDPADNYIPADRMNAANLKCNVFTKGQLQSLRQPVLVLTDLNQAPALKAAESNTLGRPTLPSISGKANYGLANAKKAQLMRALQVALAATSTPVSLTNLDETISANGATGFRDTFRTLITSSSIGLGANALDDWTPKEIAALQDAWFLPAPIQRVIGDGSVTNSNPNNSGFYDGRERRWINLLQTNIKSLTVWNRDGLYVDASNANLNTAYATTPANINAAFNNGSGTNFTNNFAFIRAAADSTKPAGSYQALGLGSTDNSEGGLVFHATVNDDLNGDGTIDTNDIQADTTKPILKKNPDGTNFIRNGSTVTFDYARKYRDKIKINNTALSPHGFDGQSPFAFAFNGGDFLPGALNINTDMPIYIQGDFNNNGAAQNAAAPSTASTARLPAAIMGDTITVLSNQCISNNPANSATNVLGVPVGQIHCGIPNETTTAADGTDKGTGGTEVETAFRPTSLAAGINYYTASTPMTINAAFLSYTDRSYGNLGAGRGFTEVGADTSLRRFSGALNNYIRMLEDWGGASGRYFNYNGSFVSLGTPLESSGRYYYGGTYYMIPSRNFNFDPFFNVSTGLPPLTPRAIYLQQQVFKRSFY